MNNAKRRVRREAAGERGKVRLHYRHLQRFTPTPCLRLKLRFNMRCLKSMPESLLPLPPSLLFFSISKTNDDGDDNDETHSTETRPTLVGVTCVDILRSEESSKSAGKI